MMDAVVIPNQAGINQQPARGVVTAARSSQHPSVPYHRLNGPMDGRKEECARETRTSRSVGRAQVIRVISLAEITLGALLSRFALCHHRERAKGCVALIA